MTAHPTGNRLPPIAYRLPSTVHRLPPAVLLAAGMVVAIVLALLPSGWTATIRGAAAGLLRPGQVAASRLRQQCGWATSRLTSRFRDTSQLADLEDQLQRLRQENRQLVAELDAVRARAHDAAADDATDDAAARLLLARCVRANVLGRQARAFLGRQHLLDVGSAEDIEPDALVVDCPAVIDRGRDGDLAADQLVLSGRRVWGKVVQSGPDTSTVRTVTERGYRDLVRVGSPRGPQGILEGSGQPLVRIRLVEATEPVAVGDPVYTAAEKGVLPEPLLYGRIVRLQRGTGAAHWQIWMQPAVSDEPDRVAVLRIELNPVRAAENAGSRIR